MSKRKFSGKDYKEAIEDIDSFSKLNKLSEVLKSDLNEFINTDKLLPHIERLLKLSMLPDPKKNWPYGEDYNFGSVIKDLPKLLDFYKENLMTNHIFKNKTTADETMEPVLDGIVSITGGCQNTDLNF